MAFAATELFSGPSPKEYKPFEPVDQMRKRFDPDTKLMIAIGGWGDAGFSEGAKDEASREKFAKNVADMLDKHGFDGVGSFPSRCTGDKLRVNTVLMLCDRHRLGIPRRQRRRLQESAEREAQGRD